MPRNALFSSGAAQGCFCAWAAVTASSPIANIAKTCLTGDLPKVREDYKGRDQDRSGTTVRSLWTRHLNPSPKSIGLSLFSELPCSCSQPNHRMPRTRIRRLRRQRLRQLKSITRKIVRRPVQPLLQHAPRIQRLGSIASA